MRKVTEQIGWAFYNRERKAVSNTTTDGDYVWLHGNAIVKRDQGGIFMTLAGWPTVTTRERLNGICEILDIRKRFYQDDFEQYFGNDVIDDHKWIQVA